MRGDSPQSNREWQEWLSDNPGQRAEVEKAQELYAALSFKENKLDSDTVQQEWEKVKAASLEQDDAWDTEEESAGKRIGRLLFRVAAAVILLSGLWAGKQYWTSLSTPTPSLARKEVANGQQLTIKLMDGSVIKLNAGSTLSYPEKFPGDRREVYLEGEAFFEVASNPKAPFIIHTDELHIKVLGTKFAVESYPENQDVRVAVVEGKVGVSNGADEAAQNEIYLVRDEMVTFEKQKKAMTVSTYNKYELLGWKDGVLHFEKADFAEIVRRLERWYGVKIRIEGEVKMSPDWRLSGKFENRSIDYILEICRYPNRFSFVVTDREVIIK
ncbi:hypothetical protein GCM10027275_36360 [Rhabdobacter roseus]|nr:FecR domain-containing protein [Rhabdobacter roseus]